MKEKLLQQLKKLIKGESGIEHLFLYNNKYWIAKVGHDPKESNVNIIDIDLYQVKNILIAYPDVNIWHFFIDDRKFSMEENRWLGPEPATFIPPELVWYKVHDTIVPKEESILPFMRVLIDFGIVMDKETLML